MSEFMVSKPSEVQYEYVRCLTKMFNICHRVAALPVQLRNYDKVMRIITHPLAYDLDENGKTFFIPLGCIYYYEDVKFNRYFCDIVDVCDFTGLSIFSQIMETISLYNPGGIDVAYELLTQFHDMKFVKYFEYKYLIFRILVKSDQASNYFIEKFNYIPNGKELIENSELSNILTVKRTAENKQHDLIFATKK